MEERWTGVISLDHDDLRRIKLREIATDLKLAPNLPTATKGRNVKTWAPHFFSKDFLKDRDDIKLEDFEMSE